jgi:cytochrome c5
MTTGYCRFDFETKIIFIMLNQQITINQQSSRGKMNHKIKSVLFISAISLFIISCEDKIVTDPEPQPTGMAAKFSEIQTKVFNVSCASSGCHGGSNVAANLNLTSGNSYNQLVNVNSLENPALKRVAPGSSGQSLLIRKLEGNGTSVMPPSGKLSKEIIDSVKAWIDRGALNN